MSGTKTPVKLIKLKQTHILILSFFTVSLSYFALTGRAKTACINHKKPTNKLVVFSFEINSLVSAPKTKSP